MRDPIHLDHNATTPVAPEVLDAMLPWLRDQFGNPSSTHPWGRRAAQAVAKARHQVADLIGAQAQEIVFTGCATEANNLALLGVARTLGMARRHLVISAIEHLAVMAPAMFLREQGWDVTVVPVDGFGRISLEDLEKSLRTETALVSVMHANNEVGTVQHSRDRPPDPRTGHRAAHRRCTVGRPSSRSARLRLRPSARFPPHRSTCVGCAITCIDAWPPLSLS